MQKIARPAVAALCLAATLGMAGEARAQCWWTGLGASCASPPPAHPERYYPPLILWNYSAPAAIPAYPPPFPPAWRPGVGTSR